MSKGYVKDHNGKFHLVDKDTKNEELMIVINQQEQLTMEELDARLKRLEGIVIGPQK